MSHKNSTPQPFERGAGDNPEASDAFRGGILILYAHNLLYAPIKLEASGFIRWIVWKAALQQGATPIRAGRNVHG